MADWSIPASKVTTTTAGGQNWAAAKPGAPAAKPPSGGKHWWQKILSSGPVEFALDTVTRPAYAVGDLIAGKPGAALAEIAPLVPVLGQGVAVANQIHQFLPNRAKILPGTALAQRGLLPTSGVLGGITKFAADVALDPTTYITFGAAGGARAAAQAARSAAITAAAKAGRQVTAEEIAHVMASAAKAAENVPKSIQMGVRIPFAGRKGAITIGKSEAAHRVIVTPFVKLGQTRVGGVAQDLFRPGGRVGPVIKDAWRATQWVNQRDKNALRGRLLDLHDEALKLDKVQGWKPGTVAQKLAYHYDNPEKYALDPVLSDIGAKTDAIRQELEQVAVEGGLLGKDQLVTNYLMHLPADRRTAKEIVRRFGKPNPENAGFMQHRIPGLNTFDDWVDAGLKPETNVFKLLEVRGNQAIDALTTRAFKDTVATHFALKRPLRNMPDIGGKALKYDKARSELYDLTRRVSDLPAAKTVLAEQRAGAAGVRRVALGAISSRAGVRVAQAEVRGAHAALGSAHAGVRAAEATTRVAGKTVGIQAYTDALAHLMAEKGNQIAWQRARPQTLMQAYGVTLARDRAREAVAAAEQRLTKAAKKADPQALTAARAEAKQARAALLAAESNVRNVATRAISEVHQATAAAGKRGVRTVAASQRALGRTEGYHAAATVGSNRSIVAKAKEVQRLKADLAKAEAKGAKVRAFNRKLRESPAAFATPEEWRNVSSKWTKLSSEIRGRVPPEIAQQVEFVMNSLDRTMNGPSAIYEAGYFINKLGATWKSLAILSPGFHFRNMYDDGLRAFFAGARNPQSYLYSAKLLAGKGKEIRVTVNGERLTGVMLMNEARSLGVVGTGLVGYEIPHAADIATRRGRFVPSMIGHGAPVKTSRRVGQAREDWMRFGTYIDLRRQGFSPIEAAERVHTHHFDYGDVSVFVSRARRFWLPFVTYATKAVPYTARQMVQHPGQLAGVSKALQELRAASGTDVNASLLPVGARLSVPIPLLGNANNPLLFNPEGVNYFTTFNQFDPNQIQRQFVARTINPLVRSPIEAATGYSFYRGRRAPDIVRAPNWMEQLSRVGINPPGFVPPGGGYRDVLTKKPQAGMGATWDVIYRNLPIYSQSDLVTGGRAGDYKFGLAKYAFGLPLQQFDRQRAQALADYFARRSQTR